jgi:hypothetical protein
MLQYGQVLQPQAGAFADIVPELPRMDFLIIFSDSGADAADRIFEGYLRGIRFQDLPDELNRLIGLLLPSWNTTIPVQSTRTQVGAWWEGDDHVPWLLQEWYYILLQMPLRVPT